MIPRVITTPAADQLIEGLRAQHGPLLFLLSGGCCEGSVPNCYKVGEIQPGQTMLLLGEVCGAPFYLGHQEFVYYENSQLTLDVVSGGSGEFSLECGTGLAFKTRSRVFTDDELPQVAPAQRAC